MKVFKKYQCSLSKEGEFKLKIIDLTKKYEPIFLKIINNEKLTSKENQLFYQGIKEIKNYIFSSLFNYNINLDNKLVIKLKTLYAQNNALSDDSIKDIIEENIYIAIGYGDKKQKNKVFNKTSENSYFIKYVQIMSIYSLLKKLENECEYYNYYTTQSEHYHIDDNELQSKEQIVDILLEKTNFNGALPARTLIKLRDVLLGKDCATPDIIPYLEYLMQFKEKNENIFN